MLTRVRNSHLLCLALIGAFSAAGAHAQTGMEKVVYSFCSQSVCADGESPTYSPILASDGNLYGTTSAGGVNQEGVFYKVSPSGQFTRLYSFCSQGGSSCTDGKEASGVVQAANGNFYGTTENGGANGFGTVFQFTSSGTFTTLYNFCSTGGDRCTDGVYPEASVIQAADGELYGTTAAGGAYGGGTVFKIDSAGALNTIYNFCSLGSSCADGYVPQVPLVQGTDGNFYGTTHEGGANGEGTIFKVTASGKLTTLHNFCAQNPNCTDGSRGFQPVEGIDGNFYGVTAAGGKNANGTVYKITASGRMTTLYNFCSQNSCSDGSTPTGGLLLGADGNFYGATQDGGSMDSGGTLFMITPTGALTTIYKFCTQDDPTCSDGELPLDGLIQDADSNLYGTTYEGGEGGANSGGGMGAGTVFKIIPPNAKPIPMITLIATPNPAGAGQMIDLKATVAGSNGAATGTVIFTLNGVTFGSAQVNGSDVATILASSNGIAPGSYPVTAIYSGNSTYSSSHSAAINIVLNKAPTSSALTASPNPVTPPASVTLTAVVKRSASGSTGTPEGSVTFYYATEALGTANLNGSGVATLKAPTNGIPVGKYSITAKYNGDTYDATSTSSAVSITVE